jgi:hypothetical protein
MIKFIHKTGSPVGWVIDSRGKVCPHFFCLATGKPITPDNPGTCYWNQDGTFVMLSCAGENIYPPEMLSRLTSSEDVDVMSYFLAENTQPKDRTDLMRRIKLLEDI